MSDVRGETHKGLPQRDNRTGADSMQKSDYKENVHIKYYLTFGG